MRRPLIQRHPVDTLMRLPEPMHPARFIILELYGQVRVTDESLPQQVNAVPDMWRGDHHWQALGIWVKLLAGDCSIIDSPIAFTYTVLWAVFQSTESEGRRGGYVMDASRTSYKTVQVVVNRECGSGWRNFRVSEVSSLVRK